MIELLIINSLFIWGIHVIMKDGYLLSGIEKLIFNKVSSLFKKPALKKYPRPSNPSRLDLEKWDDKIILYTCTNANFILKPFYICPPCMASVWGLPFVLTQPISIWTLVYLFALSGFNYIIMKIISK